MIHSSQVPKSPFHVMGFTQMTTFRPYRGNNNRLPCTCLLPATVHPTLWIMWIRYSRSKHSDMETTKLMLWVKLNVTITHRRFLSLQVVVKGFQTLRTSTTRIAIVSLVRHWLVTGQLDPPSKFKYAKLRRNCLEDLKSLKDLYQDY